MALSTTSVAVDQPLSPAVPEPFAPPPLVPPLSPPGFSQVPMSNWSFLAECQLLSSRCCWSWLAMLLLLLLVLPQLLPPRSTPTESVR